MKTWILLSSVFGLLLSAPAYAVVMVAPVEGTNLTPDEVAAISQTLASAYQVAQKEPVIPLSQVREAIEQNGGVREAANKLSANEYVYATAVRLDSRIVLTATRYAKDGTVLYSAKMTAAGLDDVEPASERLAKALLLGKSSAETVSIDTVTRTEAKTPNRTWAEKVTGFKAGFTYPIGWGHEISPMMDAGFSLRVEGRHHFIEFGVGLVLPANATSDTHLSYGGVYGDIGADFYLADSSTSPYLGFGVLPRLMSREVTNLAAYGQFGLMFFRESSTRIYTDLRVAQNVLPVGFGSSGHYDSETSTWDETPEQRLYPTELTLHVGVGW